VPCLRSRHPIPPPTLCNPPPNHQDVCNGVAGLCGVPLRSVAWLGTHNSAAVAPQLACPLPRQFANQAAPLLAQLAAGARALNFDVVRRSDGGGGGGGGGALAFGHGLCANAAAAPRAVFDSLGSWLRSHPSEALLLHIDDSSEGGDRGAAAAARRELEAALAASALRPLVVESMPSAGTPLRTLRGRAVVVFDAASWAGGGARSSSGVWLKAWSGASAAGGRGYAAAPGEAGATAGRVAGDLLATLGGGNGGGGGGPWPRDAGCGGVPFRSFSFGSADWK
jgi:hypothetical protein